MEVKVTKCANGHYYDMNKYDSCPHCGAGEFITKEPQKRKFGLFKRNSSKPTVQKTSSIQFSKGIQAHTEDLLCEDVETVGTYSTEQLQVNDEETQGVFSSSADKNVPTDKPSVIGASAVEDVLTTGFYSIPDAAENGQPEVSESQHPLNDDVKTTGFFSTGTAEETKTMSLQEQVNAATDDNDVKTTGFFAPQKESTPVTQDIQPPVGWLVCLTGKHIGEDYHLFVGKNSIGRADDNVISLPGESGVSREKHAWVIFEPKKREFYLKSGDESGLVYLNDESVFDIAPLHTGDILEVGDVKMVFVELCGEKFTWTDYINKE